MKPAREREQWRLHEGPPPWLRRDDWARGVIPGDGNHDAASFFILAAFTGLFPFMLALTFLVKPLLAGRHLQTPHLWICLTAFTSIPALVMIAHGCIARARKRRFGQPVFRMSSVPAVIGGRLEGSIEVGVTLAPQYTLKSRLRCLRKVTMCVGCKAVKTATLWVAELKVPPSAVGNDRGRSTIPVFFDIPGHCEESDDRNPFDEIIWWLEAGASAPGLEDIWRFQVPVFRV